MEIKSLLPDICTCSVKRGITTTSADCLQPEKAREKIRYSVSQAIKNIDKIKPLKFESPFEAIFEFVSPDSLNPYRDKDYCNISCDNNIVYIKSSNMKELLEKNLWGF